MTRYPFMLLLRHLIIIFAFIGLIIGFEIALTAGFNISSLSFQDPPYGELVRDRALAFGAAYLTVVFALLGGLALADFIKLMIRIEHNLFALRNDTYLSESAYLIEFEGRQVDIYAPIELKWYERVGDWVLARLPNGDGEPEVAPSRASDTSSPAVPLPGVDVEEEIEEEEARSPYARPEPEMDSMAAADEVFKRGFAAYKNKDYAEAVNLFEEAIRINPDHPKAEEGLQAARKRLE